MSAFTYTPEMDWFTAEEQGVEGGTTTTLSQHPPAHAQLSRAGANLVTGDEAAAPLGLDTALGYQIQSQPLVGTSTATGYDTLLGCQLDTTSISDTDGPPAFDFKSGSRVIEYQEAKPRRQRQTEDPQGDRFVCLWSPCKSTRTFGRVAELQRHYSTKHVRLEVFDCMAVSCPAKGDKGFTRLDKLSTHLQSHHSKNTPFVCPVSECDAGPFPPDLLWAHLRWHNYKVQCGHKPQIRYLREISFSCPMQGCKRGSHNGSHFRDYHDVDARTRDSSAILAGGWNPTSGLPICPVCNIDFKGGGSEADANHLLGHGWESLYKHRREILRVWPGFGAKLRFQQVFEDILPPVDARQPAQTRT